MLRFTPPYGVLFAMLGGEAAGRQAAVRHGAIGGQIW